MVKKCIVNSKLIFKSKCSKVQFNIRKGLVYALVGSIFLGNTSICYAKESLEIKNKYSSFESNIDKTFLTDEFYELSDDTIITYIEGVPIKKSDVDLFGIVKDGVIEEKLQDNAIQSNVMSIHTFASASTSSNSITTYKYNSKNLKVGIRNRCRLKLTNAHNEAIIKTKEVTKAARPVTDTIKIKMYLTKKGGIKYAKALEESTSKSLASFLAGFISKVGTVITVMYYLSSQKRSEIRTKVRNYTDKNKKVKIIEASTPYGLITSVSEWTGSYCPIIERQQYKANDAVYYEELMALEVKKR